MWQPPERIRHPLPETKWPTAEEAEDGLLFTPVKVGPVTCQQRTWVPAMVPWRATEDGHVTKDVIEWYARFAHGRPGVVVVEATGVRDVPSGPLLRIGHERFIPGLKDLTDAVREASNGETKLFIQLIDFLRIRRRPLKEVFFRRFLEIGRAHFERTAEATSDEAWLQASEDDLREYFITLEDEQLQHLLGRREMEDYLYGYRERVTDTHLDHVRELPEVLPGLFAGAAQRAKEAGFDGVELHYAHAYTMASFLSALNTREDGYGGSKENRAKLPLEVFHAVRNAVGADYCVGARFLGDDVIAGGNRIDEAAFFATEFAKAGFDYLSVSKGGKFEDAKQPKVGQAAYPYTGPSGYECMPTVFSDERGPFGRNVHLAKEIRDAVRNAGHETPIVTSGGIGTYEQAEEVLRNGEADIIGSARQTLADPDWFLKAKLGHGAEVRRCEYTNYCEGLDQLHKQVTCKLWDRKDLDDTVSRDHSGKRRMTAPPWKAGE